MATAVVELWPGTKVSIGPPIADGFYYDFEFPEGERPERGRPGADRGGDARAHRRRRAVRALRRARSPRRSSAFAAEDQPYKVELIEDLVRDEGVETVSLYRNGPFTDLCRGPHAPSTGRIGAFKLSSLAGAYWRGDETRQMLTRIYGTAFHSTSKDLERAPRAARAGARERPPPARARARPLPLPRRGARDAVLAAERDRAAAPDRGGGPRAASQARLRRDQDAARCSTRSSGTAPATGTTTARTCSSSSPPSARAISGASRCKPMNCPGACLVFGSERHSYRELPLRLAEFGDVSRYEREGVLHGLLRVRAFTQDDAHVYCTLDQVPDEVDSICEAIDELYARFGFDEVRVELSTRPEKSVGTDEQWERAEAACARRSSARAASTT